MPLPGSSAAIPTFMGKTGDDITDFLEIMDDAFEAFGVKEEDRPRYLVRYTSRSCKDLLTKFKNFKDKNWPAFKEELLQMWPSADQDGYYQLGDLEEYCDKISSGNITSLIQLEKATREYQRIAL